MFWSAEVALAVPPEPLKGPVPLLLPTLVGPSQAPVAMGPQRKNVTVPLGVIEGRFPTTVAVSWTGVPGVSGPAFDTWVDIVATQLPKLPRTKSFSVAVVEVEERVSARKLAKHSFATLEAGIG